MKRIIAFYLKLGSLPVDSAEAHLRFNFLLLAYEIISIKENWKHSSSISLANRSLFPPTPPPPPPKANIAILKTKQLLSRDRWTLGKKDICIYKDFIRKKHLPLSHISHWAVELIEALEHRGITLLCPLVLLRSSANLIGCQADFFTGWKGSDSLQSLSHKNHFEWLLKQIPEPCSGE